jgi:hypothetical protein
MRYRISGARQTTLGTRPRNGPAISPQPGARAVRLASPDSHYWGRQRRAGDAAQWSVGIRAARNQALEVLQFGADRGGNFDLT